MKIRFFNAKIARFGGAAPTLDAGELHVGDDGRIAHVGPAPAQPAGPFDREIDCRGGLLLPGFKNAHTHSAMTFLRSHADDLPLARWLEEQVFPYEDQLTGRDVKTLVRLAILEYVCGGQTAAFDMYFNQDEAAEAAIEAGFRFVMVSAVNDYGGTAREAEAEYRRFNELHPLIGYRIGVHAEYTTSEPLLNDMAALARALHEPFYTHLAETRAEVEGCYARYGMSPLEKLDALGAFAYGGGGFHMVHLSPADLDIAAARGAMVLDVGGGTTDIAALSLGSVVLSDTVRVAGDRFDQALIRYMKRKHELAIGERSAEDLKIAYGRAHIEKEQQVVEIRGRSLATGLPEAVPVATNELVDALAEPLRQIMEHVRALFEQTPPELAADITESGICLTGGGAQLRGLDRYIAEHTGVPCRLAEDPASCVAIGTGRVLEDLSAYRAALLDYRRGEFDR